MAATQSEVTPGFRPEMSPADWAPTSGIVGRVADAAQHRMETAKAGMEAVNETADLFWLFSEHTTETSDNRLVKASNKYFGPEKTMVGVLIVGVVLYLMPTILSKVGNAGGDNISGPLGNINSGEEAADIISFGWLVPLLMIVFMVFTYLRNAQ